MAAADEDPGREARLRTSATRFLAGHGPQRPAEVFAALGSLPDLEPDRYGEGGAVAELERQVQELLGTPALFLPSGTMAQQIALRIHADRRGRRTVAYHPTAHLELHEGRAHERLHGLVGRPIGDAHRLLGPADLAAVGEPLAALLVELPQREISGPLPAWDDLVRLVELARERGAAVHLDGARLWECTTHYGRSPAQIAALFDTVYVSFYKGLGGLAGCCLAGPADVLAEAREWRHRHGGTLFALWPYAAAALVGLRDRLPRMPQYVAHAQAIATALAGVPGVEVVPDPPVTPMMHLLLQTPPDALRAAALDLAERTGLWTWARAAATDSPGWCRVELTVGDATLQLRPDEVRDAVIALLGR